MQRYDKENQMMSTHQTRWSLAGAVTASIAASICCLGPLLAVALGVGGAWTSRISALEPYRPVSIGAMLAFLMLAFYREYRTLCAEGCSRRTSQVALWIVSPLALAMLAVPYVTPYLSYARANDRVPTTAPSGQAACCAVPTQIGSK